MADHSYYKTLCHVKAGINFKPGVTFFTPISLTFFLLMGELSILSVLTCDGAVLFSKRSADKIDGSYDFKTCYSSPFDKSIFVLNAVTSSCSNFYVSFSMKSTVCVCVERWLEMCGLNLTAARD